MHVIFLLFVFSIVILFCSIYSMIRLLGKNFILTLPGFFYAYYLVFIFIGSPIYFVWQEFDNYLYLFSTHLVLIIFPLGIYITNRISGIEFKAVFNTFLSSPIKDLQKNNIFIIIYFPLIIISIVIGILYYIKLEIVPINHLISTFNDGINVKELAQLREASTTSFVHGKLHRYRFFIVQLLPFLTVLSFIKLMFNKNKIWLLIFIILSFICIYFCIADLQKRPILDFIILLFLTRWIFQGKIHIKHLLILGFLLCIILGFMYYYIMGLSNRTTYILIDAIFSRLIFSQTASLYQYFNLIPSIQEYLFGLSLPNPAGIFDFKHFNLSAWIYATSFGNEWGISGTAPSVFIGEIYANFGYPIMLLSILYMSMFLQYIQNIFITRQKTLLLTSYYVYFVYLSSQLALTSAFVVIHLYLVIFILVGIYLSDGYKILSKIYKH